MHPESRLVVGEGGARLTVQRSFKQRVSQLVDLPGFDPDQLLAVHFDIRQTDIATGVEVQSPETQVGFPKVAVAVVYAQIVQTDAERGESIEDA